MNGIGRHTEIDECWMSPYGEVIFLDVNESWAHAAVAGRILNERYGYNFNLNRTDINWTDKLYEKGWISYTHCMNVGWLWGRGQEPTTDQCNKVFELTGEILEF